MEFLKFGAWGVILLGAVIVAFAFWWSAKHLHGKLGDAFLINHSRMEDDLAFLRIAPWLIAAAVFIVGCVGVAVPLEASLVMFIVAFLILIASIAVYIKKLNPIVDAYRAQAPDSEAAIAE